MRPDGHAAMLGRGQGAVLAQQRQAQAGAHQALGRGGGIAFHDLIGAQPLAGEQRQQQGLLMVLRGCTDPGQLRQVLPARLQDAFAQRGRRRHAVVQCLQHQGAQVARHVGADVERALQAAGRDLRAQLLGPALACLDVQQRQRLHQAMQQRAQAQRLGVGHRAQQQLAGDLALQLAGLALQASCRIQHLPGGLHQGLASPREADAARAPVEQRHAQLFLQRLDLGRDGGLRQVQGLGRARDAAQRGRRDVGAQLIHLHGRPA
ncbi:conserved hypothetical protein [Ricinus communis]|uniref:Uncharacterized protein n=1 Tax=Ricinus communis TaxID=3988 RepID=B9TMI7_RICCO|nr:conserved hypothetical protein [Ricinus communis]